MGALRFLWRELTSTTIERSPNPRARDDVVDHQPGENRKIRGRMAQAAYAGAVLRHAPARHRAGLLRALLERKACRHLCLRVLRHAVVRIRDEIRFRNGLAELLGAARPGCGG